MKTQHKQSGFTLIELLVVISIIGMLASVVLASLSGARAKGIEAASKTFDTHVFQAFGADAYVIYNFNDGKLPPTDSSGNGIVLGCSGISTTTNAILGKALTLTRNGACGLYLGLSQYNFKLGNGAISFWILQPTTDFTSGYITLVRGVWLNLNNTGKIYISQGGSLMSNSSLTLGQWNHVLLTWGNGTARYYINGKLDTASGAVPTFNAGDGSSLYLGSAGSSVDATIDQFAVYTQSMQTAQVEQLYASQLPSHILADATK